MTKGAGPSEGRLLVLVGTKAQLIKTAPILKELEARGACFEMIYTGQHAETFSEIESAFTIRSADDCVVPLMESDSRRGLIGWAVRFSLGSLRRVLSGSWRGARWGIVHGDTASTLLSALALRAAGVPVAHVEAGLRSPRLFSPFPEEIIRRVVSRLSRLHLAPDRAAADNLAGVRGKVLVTQGNTIRDALRYSLSTLAPSGGNSRGGSGAYAIASIHRHENLADKARFDLLMRLVVETSRKIPVHFVLHPVTRRLLRRSAWWSLMTEEPGLSLCERVDYVSFVGKMIGARFLMTDGGSNQEEAAIMGLPTLLLRAETERPDGIGANITLSALNPEVVADFVESRREKDWRILPIDSTSPSKIIVEALLDDRKGDGA
jgi:UDP-N-acetylglucosamine 2-epimerase (non-hydrolysing)